MYKLITVTALAAVFAFSAYPGYTDNLDGRQVNLAQVASPQVHQGRGTVNKVNTAAGKINISHEAISSLKWPKMTMDFSVQNMADLEAIKPGMPVDFELTQKGTGYMISNIKPVK